MINPLKITQNQFDKRWDELPEVLRELLYSPEHAEIIRYVCENNHLSEDKTGTVLGIVGGVIMGFVHVQDLDRQIAKHLDINVMLARSISSDIKERVLKRFENEVGDAFQPVLASELGEEQQGGIVRESVELDVIGAEHPEETKNIPISPVSPKPQGVPERTETILNTPFILHEEKKPETAAEGRSSFFKSISVPLGFFKSKNQSAQTTKPIRVEVEAPKSERRTVNYSELRTSLSPFENQSFIKSESASSPIRDTSPDNLEEKKDIAPAILPETEKIPEKTKLPDFVAEKPAETAIKPPQTTLTAPSATLYEKTTSANASPSSPSTDTKPTKSFFGKTGGTPNEPGILGTIKKNQPKIEGNTIDLKNG
ncbi:hypothetical protein D4R51_02425 [bacterium]|nr:MAG: hypothetical protein D4R51_02425 [bacterium]